MKRILITGGSGFIGHHVIEHILKNTDWQIVSLDRLSVSGNYNRLTDLECWAKEGHRVKLVHHDLRSPINDVVHYSMCVGDRSPAKAFDYILHMAASTHVDRSITDPMGFVLDNVVATTNILMYAREQEALEQFVYFSTDEVFGPAPIETAYTEWARYNSGNPYAAAKAGGEEMALAFANTYNIPVIITHTMNVFGERQHPEKFIPMTIKKVLAGEKIIIHANKTKTQAGSRMWIHARNVAAGILFLLEGGANPDRVPRPTYWRMPNADKFNLVGEREVDNLAMAQFIYDTIWKLKDPHDTQERTICVPHEMVDFHSSRPGHDLRYALDGSKMKGLGWSLPVDFEDSLRQVIEWSIKNNQWLK